MKNWKIGHCNKITKKGHYNRHGIIGIPMSIGAVSIVTLPRLSVGKPNKVCLSNSATQFKL